MSRENSYASLDADGQVPLTQLDNAAGGGPHNHAGEDITSGTVADARVASTVARDSEVATAVSDHAAAANPHPTYETAAEVLAQIGTHAGLSDPHPGYLTPAEGNAAYEAAGGIATHASDTTAIHGIADTSALSLTSHDHDADYEAAGGIATHSADSTSVHGIADTSALALTGHTHTHAATTGQGIDDHHARDHAINAAVHTGTLDDAQIPAGITRDAEAAAAYAAVGHTHSGASTAYAPGSFTVATGNYMVMVDELELTGAQEVILEGTATLRIT